MPGKTTVTALKSRSCHFCRSMRVLLTTFALLTVTYIATVSNFFG